jgi:hypothetical protein
MQNSLSSPQPSIAPHTISSKPTGLTIAKKAVKNVVAQRPGLSASSDPIVGQVGTSKGKRVTDHDTVSMYTDRVYGVNDLTNIMAKHHARHTAECNVLIWTRCERPARLQPSM